MPDPVSAPDPQSMRISDAERDQVADVLREAAAEGRIDFAELDERLHGVFSARTYAELPPLVSDLPGVRVPSPVTQTTPARGPAADGPALERFDASTAVMRLNPNRRCSATVLRVMMTRRPRHSVAIAAGQ